MSDTLLERYSEQDNGFVDDVRNSWNLTLMTAPELFVFTLIASAGAYVFMHIFKFVLQHFPRVLSWWVMSFFTLLIVFFATYLTIIRYGEIVWYDK